MAAQLRKILRQYAQGLASIVAFLCEARIRQDVAEQVEFFVEAFESGLNDCAIYAGSGTLQNRGGAADTLFVQLASHGGKEVLVSLDVKQCSAKCDSGNGIQFSFKISPGQRLSCQAVIILSPKEPDFVILVPLHYLPKKDSPMRFEVVLSSYRALWTLHPPPAFPPEYAPFIFPFARVENALKNMRAYFDRSSNVW